MNLQDFFPYRLAVLAEAVSRSIALVYTARFNLTRDEWRVLAALAETGAMKTTHVIEHTTLDKMQVSRAVKQLACDGYLDRTGDPDDGRGYVLQLTPQGRTLYRKVVPMVQAREAFLLEDLTPEERAALDSALRKVWLRTHRLVRQD
jgi:DNA-binding MarR family transcriptional regulator